MTDLTQSQWRAIINASVYLPQECEGQVGRFIGLAALRRIIRESKRTLPQNALLWSLYDEILERGGEEMAGWQRTDLHEFFLIEHFGAETQEMFGRKRLKPIRRSSKLTKTEFAEFIDHVVRFMAERGVVLEVPGEQAA